MKSDQIPDGEPVDGDSLDAVLTGLLGQYPGVPIAAIGEDGIFRDIPADPMFEGHPVLEARSALDLVVAIDRVVVIEAWERARNNGIALSSVRLAGEDAHAVALSFVDVRHRFGVYIGVFVPQDVDGSKVDVAPGPVLPVRVAKIRKDEVAVVTGIDPAATQILGWGETEMVGRRSIEFIHPDDQERAINNWMAMLKDAHSARPVRLRHMRKDGSWVWLEITNHYVPNDGDGRYVMADIVDISEEMAAQESLRSREQLLDRLAQSVPLGLFQIDVERRIVYTNERLGQIVGVDVATTVSEQFAKVVADDRDLVHDAIELVLTDQKDLDIEVRLDLAGEGGPRRCGVSIHALTDTDGAVNGAIASVVDVTESVRMRVELEDRATFDALTRCHNRASVMSSLQAVLENSGQDGTGTSVVFLDLDRFKPVNDRLGHSSGDNLLEIVAERLRSVVRSHDIIGRFGGDEFLVVCPGVRDEAEALKISGRMAEVLHGEAILPAGTVDVRASVGVAWSDEPGIDAGTLVVRSDTAMYESKRQGAGRPVLYGATLHPVVPKGLEDERWLRDALATDALEVYYQPIVELTSGVTVGYEALLRGPRDGRMIVAGEFIELAEQTGLIHEIGEIVREQTCAQASAVGRIDELRWAINVSPLEIAAPGLASAFERTLRTHAIDPSQIIIEVTEHSSLGDSSNARTTLHELHELGLSLALDDFGTGWSSLELLRTLPISIIKIDRSFTNEVTTDRRSRLLVESMAEMARRLDLQVVIEGVETTEQRNLLIHMGATVAQGWLFAPARSAADLFGTMRVSA